MQLDIVPEGQIIELFKKNSDRLWIDLKYSNYGELEQWFENLNIKDVGHHIFSNNISNPGFYPLKDEILMVLPVITETNEIDWLLILCRENLILTTHKNNISNLEQKDLEKGADSWLFEASIPALLSAILMDLSLDCMNQANLIEKNVEVTEKEMDNNPRSIEYKNISNLRAKQLLLETVVSGQVPSIAGIKVVEKTFFNLVNVKDYLNCSQVNLFATRDLLDRLEHRILDLRSRFEMNSQEKGNRRLNMLTIISAVFMPITFLAGIWGMNFENMPELGHPYSYPIALTFMLLIVIGMFFFFKKHGWFNE